MGPTATMEKSTAPQLDNVSQKALSNLEDAKGLAMDTAPTPIRAEVVNCIDEFMKDVRSGRVDNTQRRYYANVSPNVLVRAVLAEYNFPYNRPSDEEFEQ
ncbi:MAG TPA: hypothetical protein VJH97_00155 [Candidatus Nanoarchaeia archaeon]|nr:hypothetical protein [Candidatus Nanoarchaeia archaeon]